MTAARFYGSRGASTASRATATAANGRWSSSASTLVWAIDCLNIGYLFLRNLHAANRKWDDAKELAKMENILLHGSASAPRKLRRRVARAR